MPRQSRFKELKETLLMSNFCKNINLNPLFLPLFYRKTREFPAYVQAVGNRFIFLQQLTVINATFVTSKHRRLSQYEYIQADRQITANMSLKHI